MEKKQEYQKIITRRPNGSKRVATRNTLPTMTDQQYKEDTDINIIMDRFQKTGIIRHFNKKEGHYADVSEIPDLLTASTIVQDANQKFMALPASIRAEFENDPHKLNLFLQDPRNRDKAIELNLISKPTPDPIETAFENALEKNDKKRTVTKPQS